MVDISQTLTPAMLAAVIEQMPAGVYIGTPTGLVFCNAVGLQMLGFASTADLEAAVVSLLPRLRVRDAATGQPLALEEIPFARALRGETSTRDLLYTQHGSRREIAVRSAAAPLKENGSVVSAVCINIDITESRRALSALSETEERFHLLVEGAHDYAMILLDIEGRVVHWNTGAERILGYAEPEIVGQHIQTIFTPEDCAAGIPERELTVARQEGHATDDRWHQRRDGVRFWADGVMERLLDGGGNLRGFAKILRDTTARKAAEDAARDAAERERLIRQIGDSVRSSSDPDVIQEAAAAALGAALNADRCWFVISEAGEGEDVVVAQWHRPDLPALTGQSLLTNPENFLTASPRAFAAMAMTDLGDSLPPARAVLLSALGLRALLSVPLREAGRLTGTLSVGMTDTPRVWTPEEIALVEAVAAQTRTAADAARVRLREQKIATHLQAALQPGLPPPIPGLTLTKFYEAALEEEEGVGGDFYDVFPLEENCTALVVGDLSGKGLEAAAEVATVRNMLRAALYLGRTLASAITDLNTILADHALLRGFATLFVGIYDSRTGVLNYVNCGQEPALVRRAGSRAVEELPPTGPILGALSGARFTQSRVSLKSGDALAVFTDGLTEAGPDRIEMLGVEGVAALLAAPSPLSSAVTPEERAEEIMVRLISGVDTFAGAGIRDDVCLLVAVVDLLEA